MQTTEADCALAEHNMQDADEESQQKLLERLGICTECGEFEHRCDCGAFPLPPPTPLKACEHGRKGLCDECGHPF